MTAAEVRRRITDLFQTYLSTSRSVASSLLPASVTAGKLYEAYVLALVSRELVANEGVTLRLVRSNALTLKSAPGPINRQFPCIEILRAGSCIAEMWTDVEFVSLSYSITAGGSRPAERGEFHELDIAVVDPGLTGRPAHSSVWLAVECKNTGYHKALLKEILGVRRELSLLQDPQATHFLRWPRSTVPANPPSCLVVYASDPRVIEYARPGEVFGIDFYHEELAL